MATINGTIIPNGRKVYLLASGAVNAGGSVGFYTPATVNPVTTYQDSALTVPNAQTGPVSSVPLDAAGTCLAWFSGQAREIVYDAAGATVSDSIVYALPPAGLGAGFGAQTVLASANTADLGSISSHNVLLSGVTTIASFGNSAALSAPLFLVTTQSALQITQSAALLTPSGLNLNLLAGDAFFAEFLGAGNWQILAVWTPSRLVLHDSSAAHDVQIAATSSVALTATRTFTLDLANGDRTLKLTGNATLNQDVSTLGSPSFVSVIMGGVTSKVGQIQASANSVNGTWYTVLSAASLAALFPTLGGRIACDVYTTFNVEGIIFDVHYNAPTTIKAYVLNKLGNTARYDAQIDGAGNLQIKVVADGETFGLLYSAFGA